jgi:acyl-CoA synthetase (NDP forming)
MMNLQALFKPKTMAVIGVSTSNDRHPANVIYIKNHHRYPVEVFAVNPRGGTIEEAPIFPAISDIPEQIELAVIAARAEYVPDILKDCIKSDVKAAIVISGGFSEVGRLDLQDRMVAMAREADFPFIGPNCLGIYVPKYIDSFFLPVERIVKPDEGNVALISQSGGILVDQMIKFADEGVGLSKAVSIGNKAFVKELDLLNFLARDRETKVIAFYVEGFGKDEGREFVLAAEKCPKPVIVLKSGKSSAGQRAVSSHTASLAGDYQSFSAALAQHDGVVEALNELELVSFCESMSAYQTSINGNIGIVTGSGGHGALAVDACSVQGLSIPELGEETRKEIEEHLSSSVKAIASIRNPADLTGSAIDDDFVWTVRALCTMPEIECVITLLLPYLPGITMDLGSKLSAVSRQMGKPLIAYVPHVDKYRMLIEGFELNGIPVSPSIEGAVLMATALRRSKPW